MLRGSSPLVWLPYCHIRLPSIQPVTANTSDLQSFAVVDYDIRRRSTAEQPSLASAASEDCGCDAQLIPGEVRRTT